MPLKAALTRGRLRKAERRARKLHGLQRRYRRFIEELNENKKGMDPAKYESKKAELEGKRHKLVEEMKHVEEDERRLRAELKALERAA